MITNFLYQIVFCIIFLVLLFFVSKLLQKWNGKIPSKSNKKLIKLIEKQYVGKDMVLALVEVNDEQLLLGMTSAQVSLIKKMENNVCSKSLN